jgi:hypothetical protein
MNIFAPAIAGEDTNQYMNNEDYLQRYEKFYKDDKFREAYYNYHKQHHHQEEQQQVENEVQHRFKQQQQQSSITGSILPQDNTQQNPSIIAQEQMHQQQIEKLKQLLIAIR